jgi:hypothetical protein
MNGTGSSSNVGPTSRSRSGCMTPAGCVPARGGASFVSTLALLVWVVMVPVDAYAVPVKILDFNNLGSASEVSANLVYQGLRFSPGCHYDVLGSGGAGGSSWIGFDNAGCFGDSQSNADYLGPDGRVPGQATMLVDFGNHPFSLVSLMLINPGSWISISTSKGGYVDLTNYWSCVSGFSSRSCASDWVSGDPLGFSGGKWNGIRWALLTVGDTGVPGGFDNLTVRVPAQDVSEPSTIGLIGLGLIALGFTWRSKRR